MLTSEVVEAAAKRLVRLDIQAEAKGLESGLSVNQIRDAAWAEQPPMLQRLLLAWHRFLSLYWKPFLNLPWLLNPRLQRR